MMEGVFAVYKEEGMSSHSVVEFNYQVGFKGQT